MKIRPTGWWFWFWQIVLILSPFIVGYFMLKWAYA